MACKAPCNLQYLHAGNDAKNRINHRFWKMGKKVNQKIDFEKSMEELEKIVEDLESGTLTLDQSISAFERGIELSKHCQKRLVAAEERVKKLLEKADGDFDLELFEEEGNKDG